MKIVTRHDAFGVATTRLTFSDRERATLAAAARIAGEARDRCASFAGKAGWELTGMDDALAGIEHGPAEVAGGILLRESCEGVVIREAS